MFTFLAYQRRILQRVLTGFARNQIPTLYAFSSYLSKRSYPAMLSFVNNWYTIGLLYQILSY